MLIDIPNLPLLAQWIPNPWKPQRSRIAMELASVVAQSFQADFSKDKNTLTFSQAQDGCSCQIDVASFGSSFPQRVQIDSYHTQVSLTDKSAHGSDTGYSVLEISYLNHQGQEETRLLRVDRQNLKSYDPAATDPTKQWPGFKYDSKLKALPWETGAMHLSISMFTNAYQRCLKAAKKAETFWPGDNPGITFSQMSAWKKVIEQIPIVTKQERLIKSVMAACWFFLHMQQPTQETVETAQNSRKKTLWPGPFLLQAPTNNLLNMMRQYPGLDPVVDAAVYGVFLIDLLVTKQAILQFKKDKTNASSFLVNLLLLQQARSNYYGEGKLSQNLRKELSGDLSLSKVSLLPQNIKKQLVSCAQKSFKEKQKDPVMVVDHHSVLIDMYAKLFPGRPIKALQKKLAKKKRAEALQKKQEIARVSPQMILASLSSDEDSQNESVEDPVFPIVLADTTDTTDMTDTENLSSLGSIGTPPDESVFDENMEIKTNSSRLRANARAHLHASPPTVGFWGMPLVTENDADRLMENCSF